jgi:hypothetical protein
MDSGKESVEKSWFWELGRGSGVLCIDGVISPLFHRVDGLVKWGWRLLGDKY